MDGNLARAVRGVSLEKASHSEEADLDMSDSAKTLMPLLAVAMGVVAVCGGAAAVATRAPDAPSGSPEAGRPPAAAASPAPSDDAAQVLSQGMFRLAAAGSFGESGFHETIAARQELPQRLGETAGLKLVLRLRDAGRPGQRCSRDHPLSGCATVDWSDSTGRPKVPPEGVFENSLTLQLVSGTRTYYLSEAGTLEDEPDRFQAG